MVALPVLHLKRPYRVNPSKIIALGLNYRDHIAESHSVQVRGFTDDIPEEPVLFPKTPNVLIGTDEPIVLPRFVKDYGFAQIRTDYEAELALIIGQKCRNVPASEAYAVIYGYTCMNDVSQRNLQTGDRAGWFRGKSLDTFGPIGPRIVRQRHIGDPMQLEIRCRLNGQIVQESNTCHMIFSIPEIIAFISNNFTLMPGDLILTGTPSGVGPIKDGDIVEVEIEKIGTLRNPVREET
jgi:2-keto-4-pentenoate hydratase/2-oxohepta-3-ene-1,7-dioic acid hydratase in catechol pathway